MVVPTQVEEGGEVVITGDNLRLLLDIKQLGKHPQKTRFFITAFNKILMKLCQILMIVSYRFNAVSKLYYT
jgi:hypothetical protein